MSPKGKRVTASEIGQYAFCPRAWFFRTVEKVEPLNVEALGRGTIAHERHGWQVLMARGLVKLALVSFAVAALLTVAWGITRLLP